MVTVISSIRRKLSFVAAALVFAAVGATVISSQVFGQELRCRPLDLVADARATQLELRQRMTTCYAEADELKNWIHSEAGQSLGVHNPASYSAKVKQIKDVDMAATVLGNHARNLESQGFTSEMTAGNKATLEFCRRCEEYTANTRLACPGIEEPRPQWVCYHRDVK
jgi:hypothetical protein